jgi:ankyrin repeat protein
MNPNFPPPPPDPNSSSLAYLNHHPPGTQPHYQPVQGNPPQLGNRPAAEPVLPNPQQDLMDIDSGEDSDIDTTDDTFSSDHGDSPDNEPGRGLKRTRPETDGADAIEHSEPVCKQRRTGSTEPAVPAIQRSAKALQKELLEAVAGGKLDKLQSLVHQTDSLRDIFTEELWEVATTNGHLAIIEWLCGHIDSIDLPRPRVGDLFEKAAQAGQLEVMKYFVRFENNIEQIKKNSDALIVSAKAGHLEVVKYLVELKFDLERATLLEQNALHAAAYFGHFEVVKYLIESGCAIDKTDCLSENALIFAARSGHLEVVKWLANRGCDIHQANHKGRNALILAAQAGHLDVVKYLGENGCNSRLMDVKGNNALTLAAKFGHLEVVKWLADQGCDIRQINNDNNNALTLAAPSGHLEVVKWLADQGCDIRQINNDNNNALTLAAQSGHLEVVKWLADQGCDVRRINRDNNNALMLAAESGHLEVVKWLADQGCDIRQINNDDNNALMLAAESGHIEVVKWLADQGCDIRQINHDNNNALMLAAQSGHFEVVKWLAAQGCDIRRINSDNNNALMLAAQSGHLEVVKWLADQGCDVRRINSDNNNALMLAAKAGHLGVVRFLASSGVNIDQLNSYGDTALALSMKFLHCDVACHLIRRGASVMTGLRSFPDGLLFKALQIEDPELINLLIPLHDMSKRSAIGRTPLMIAAERNLIEVAIPMIQATMSVPSCNELREEALAIASGALFKELLVNFSVTLDQPNSHSYVEANGTPILASNFVRDHLLSQYVELHTLQTSLGAAGVMTPMQMACAKVSVVADLTAWKLQHPDLRLFTEHLPPSLVSVRKKLIAFINKDIELLVTQALQWEEDRLIPVVENLYESCLSHSLSAQPAMDITSELNAKGLYHPIAQRIAAAWTSAWATVAEEAAPLLRPATMTHIEDSEREDLADLDTLTGAMAVNPNTVTRTIGQFVDAPVSSSLLQAFRTALRREFDSVEGKILRAQDVNLSEQSKALYADLVGRQLHLIAQFWRAET